MSDDAPTDKPAPHAETVLAQAGVGEDCGHGAIAPPLYLSSTYLWDDPDKKPAYDYGRSRTPTRSVLETLLAELEGGGGALVCATGMAAIGLPLDRLPAGAKIVAPHDCYGGTYRLLAAHADKGRFEVRFLDQTTEEALRAARDFAPDLIYLETPSNPLMRITDLSRWTALAKEIGALTLADNTFLSPILQRPLEWGCDMVVHSTTKYINGHTDIIGGALITKDPELASELAWWANATGVTGASFDSYMTLRGARTLSLRVHRAQATAGQIADALVGHPAVVGLNYPGLGSHPQHALIRRQQKGPGAMMSFDLAPSIDPRAFLAGLEVFTPAASLGGFESLVCIPAIMTHAGMTPAARAAAGLGDRLVRLSIGLEHPEDLLNDLTAAFARGEA
ncbi:cystathionine gamma-synthase [Parvularcula bermudensis HTCC2503]|uniref:Cystathionine gamma-synthase n=1 Tax=Parvularcula bermudensis (strain ATCC BAA-594 / HTCC2503 / KCTC 12087) TaxID=314260 RepID=E0TH68_PARBH|nr:PLP-dependent transferase [Parvularcula bermudensis]ADM09652.1 cystathionine gamma-synthase [Parvularcula bermudensis HTCC2503]